MRRIIFLLTVGILLSLTIVGWAGDTGSGSVQVVAKLTDVYGEVLPSDYYCLKFDFFKLATDEELLWSATVDPVFVNEDGFIDVKISSIPSHVFNDGSGTDDGVRFIQILTCEYLYIGNRNPFTIIASTLGSTDGELPVKTLKAPSLIDTNGDTVRMWPYMPMSAETQIEEMKTLLLMIQGKLKKLEHLNRKAEF